MTKLRVVDGDSPGNKPPRKLGKPGSVLWRNVMREYEISDCASLEMLTMACTQLDRAEEYRAQIARDGLVVKGRTGPKEHPLLRPEAAARSFIVRTLRALSLGADGIRPGPGRPPTPLGWIPDDDE
jgi:hypothetical protein